MSTTSDLLLLSAEQVRQTLAGRELDIIQAVRAAYETHRNGGTNLPNSVFLHPPDTNDRRIIALPAWLGGDEPVAGIKWIASFPQNHNRGLDRASAVIILNSTETGFPEAILEGSIVSAKRTAASAALASNHLNQGQDVTTVGLIGCGPINFEILRFLRSVHSELKSVFLFDQQADRMEQFSRKCRNQFDGIDMTTMRRTEDILERTTLISFATTAAAPHVNPLLRFLPGTTILHISLRDLPPEIILSADNIVDDVDHVCRAQTSVHLAEQAVGNRDFIRCTLADITSGKASSRVNRSGLTVFSPFGLGILDMAVARLVTQLARKNKLGQTVPAFLPPPWAST
jgi:N-[(2S)-2-amino-2-carboxyethyl]-L-glutamate dehydrogenase